MQSPGCVLYDDALLFSLCTCSASCSLCWILCAIWFAASTTNRKASQHVNYSHQYTNYFNKNTFLMNFMTMLINNIDLKMCKTLSKRYRYRGWTMKHWATVLHYNIALLPKILLRKVMCLHYFCATFLTWAVGLGLLV